MKTKVQQLRKTVRKMMIDANLGRRATADLADALGLNLQSLSMAMSKYRAGPRSVQMLTSVKRYLQKRGRHR